MDSVYGMLTLLTLVVISVSALSKSGELSAPHSFGVVDVNVDPGAKGVLEIIVVHLPRDDLGVGALKVGFVLNVTGVGEEELADVWQDYRFGHRSLYPIRYSYEHVRRHSCPSYGEDQRCPDLPEW